MFKPKSKLCYPILLILGLAPMAGYAVNTTIVGTVGDLNNSGSDADERALVESAAACWDARITTNRNFTLEVSGSSLTGGTLGTGFTSAVNASNIPTEGITTFDNDGSTVWYVAPAPGGAAPPTDTYDFDPIAGSQWQFQNGPNRADLYSTLLHEFGHAHGWLCGEPCGFTNPNYDAMKNPSPGNFVSNSVCTSPFPVAGQAPNPGCVHLQSGAYDVSLRGDGLGGSGSSVVNELSHPGVGGDLMLGFSGGNGVRRTISQDNLRMFREAYGDTVNLPPTLNPQNITEECSVTGGADIILDANAQDPENNPLTYNWRCPADVTLNDDTAANPEGFFPLGTKRCRVDVNDNVAACLPNAAEFTVRVQDTTKPNLTCPTAVTLECSAPGGNNATDSEIAAFLAGASVNDICDANPSLNNDAPDFFDLGVTPVKFSSSDKSGNTASCSSNVTIQDTTPPEIESLTATPASLWPPNHKMVNIMVDVSVSDVCDPSASCKITSVSSNEPVNGLGDGNTSPDWNITGDLTVELRAERSGKSSGRVYTITVECSDASNNTSQKTVDVKVAHDQR